MISIVFKKKKLMKCFIESILAEILSGEKNERMLSMDEKWMILSSLSELCVVND